MWGVVLERFRFRVFIFRVDLCWFIVCFFFMFCCLLNWVGVGLGWVWFFGFVVRGGVWEGVFFFLV